MIHNPGRTGAIRCMGARVALGRAGRRRRCPPSEPGGGSGARGRPWLLSPLPSLKNPPERISNFPQPEYENRRVPAERGAP